MHIKVFFISFLVVYILFSLPSIFGFGYEIDWVKEATLFEKFSGYVITGLFNGFKVKVVIAFIVGLLISIGAFFIRRFS